MTAHAQDKKFHLTKADLSPLSLDVVTEVLQKKLDFVHMRLGIRPDELITVHPEAFKMIYEISNANIGFALFLLHESLPISEELMERVPFNIDRKRVKELDLTQSDFEAWARDGWCYTATVNMDKKKQKYMHKQNQKNSDLPYVEKPKGLDTVLRWFRTTISRPLSE